MDVQPQEVSTNKQAAALSVREVVKTYALGESKLEVLRGVNLAVPPGEMCAVMGVDIPRLARDGVTIFFTQVFRDGFFHADMHQGNLFVTPEGQIAAIAGSRHVDICAPCQGLAGQRREGSQARDLDGSLDVAGLGRRRERSPTLGSHQRRPEVERLDHDPAVAHGSFGVEFDPSRARQARVG